MSNLSKERDLTFLNAAQEGIFEISISVSDLFEVTSLYNEKLIDSNVVAFPSEIIVSWKDPYQGAWPLSVYNYIYGKQNEFPESSIKNLAEKLFIIAKKVEVENNK